MTKPNFKVFFSDHRKCLIIQRLNEEGKATGGIELYEHEYNDFKQIVRDGIGLLRVRKLIESGNLPSIKIKTVGENIEISQNIPCNGIVVRLPEGLELLNMKLKEHINDQTKT